MSDMGPVGLRLVSTKWRWNCVLLALAGSSGEKLTHLIVAHDPSPPSTSCSVHTPPTYLSTKSWAAKGSAHAIVFFRGRSTGRSPTTPTTKSTPVNSLIL